MYCLPCHRLVTVSADTYEGVHEGLHSTRGRSYRINYRLDHDLERVDVIAIEHRADAYRLRDS